MVREAPAIRLEQFLDRWSHRLPARVQQLHRAPPSVPSSPHKKEVPVADEDQAGAQDFAATKVHAGMQGQQARALVGRQRDQMDISSASVTQELLGDPAGAAAAAALLSEALSSHESYVARMNELVEG